MSYQNPSFSHPQLPTNKLGYTKTYYKGVLSTLCAGCGHDSVSAAVIQACFELSIEPHKVAKMSGIGCSSKTPAYFLKQSHGFNSVHGRMPSVATGANLANKTLTYIGVSGDGDTASIGMGQFAHVVRRNLNMVYLVDNNGCYGLTKGQDSATCDQGSKSKKGAVNLYQPIDLAVIAIELGATFVARSFSGDRGQLVPILKAAICHQGFALIDVISPCVTFNDNKESTKSYQYTREHMQAADIVDFVPFQKEITVDYPQGSRQSLTLHDGSVLNLQKIDKDFDPQDAMAAIKAIRDAQAREEVLTGLLYHNNDASELHQMLNTSEQALNTLNRQQLCPGNEVLQQINNSLR